MHARVSTYETQDPDGLIEGLGAVTGELEQVDGFSHAYFMVDREAGKALSITIWDSEDAAVASRGKADELRRRGTEPSGSSISSVEQYEITQVVGSPAGVSATSRTAG
jgi:heme-degrading monooxygenase HmoA